MIKKTPLINEYHTHNAKLICFHGWKLPLEFTGSTIEHLNVRKNVGLFDISHMGRIRIKGAEALNILEKHLTNNVTALKKNHTQYNFLCNKQGGIIDDLILYCLDVNDYLLCVNASRREVVLQWLCSQNPFLVHIIKDETNKWGQVALHGPKSSLLLSKILNDSTILELKKNQFKWYSFLDTPVLVSVTGYTGEWGFEIFICADKVASLWRQIIIQGKPHSCMPSGLAARDTLRMEMKYPLYGNDLNINIDPHSAGLSWVVKNPKNFIGSTALLKLKLNKKKKWVGFKLLSDAGVPRSGSAILVNKKYVGEVTSGAKSPCLGYFIGLGYVPIEYSSLHQKIEVEIHKNPVSAKIVATPFIQQSLPIIRRTL